jgi:prophage maintenance system killer protein
LIIAVRIFILYDRSTVSFSRENMGQGFRQAKRNKIRYPDFQAIVRVNRKVVTLTSDEHVYTKDDEQKIRRLLADVRKIANDEEPAESIIQKTSLLIFQIAGGQHFHEGNKRTALAVAEAFLKFNGYTMNVKDSSLLDVVYKASMGQAGLSNVRDIIRQLIKGV